MKPDYKPFSRFVLRTPLQPMGCPMEGTALFREAIYLASPELYEGNQSGNPKKQQKFEESNLKYHNRASTRCTPFGLFAGCSVGQVGDKTQIELLPAERNGRCTRLDMQYLCALIQHIERMPGVRPQLRFYPNDSLYKIGGKYRYIEYHYRKTQRLHNTVSLGIDEPLEQLLDAAAGGATIRQLAELFVDDEITYDEAAAYVEEVIDSQVLKSELDPCVVGGDVLATLIEKLSCLHDVAVLDTLRRIQALLGRIDTEPIGTTLPLYEQIIELIKGLGVEYEAKFLFQTDMTKPVCTAVVSEQTTQRLARLIAFLARITPGAEHPGLSAFIKVFQERYEEAEVPLAQVLDGELGIGYPASQDAGSDVSPLVNDLMIPGQTSYVSELRLTPADRILLQKYTECIRNHGTVVTLTDADFKDFDFTHTLPDTMAVMCSLLGEGRLYVKSVGGVSGASLLGRFCHVDSALCDLVNEVAEFEKQREPDRILAELSHLPESRIGNIASRPLFRDYTLHYLSNCDCNDGIPVSDLMLSVRQGRLLLRSQKYAKEVLPRLTCAHNYSMSPIPVYRFLCELQHQGRTSGLFLGWNGYLDTLDYLPRLQYEEMILTRQRWRILLDDLKELDKLSDGELVAKMHDLAVAKSLPRHVVVPDSDNELYLDLEDARCLRLMLSLAQQRKGILLEEFLFDAQDAVVRQGGDAYTNEAIFVFHK